MTAPDPGTLRGPRLDRRRLLGGAVAAAVATAAAAAVPTGAWRRLVDVEPVPLGVRLAALPPWTPAVRAVGEAYLATRPQHRDAQTLTTLLAADLGLAGRPVPRDLRRAVLDAVHADFEARRTLRLQGWVASPTEAHLAALTVVRHDATPR